MLDALDHAVVTFDNLSAGFRDAVLGGEIVRGSCGNTFIFIIPSKFGHLGI
jgi:UDP-glucose 4-epimerase